MNSIQKEEPMNNNQSLSRPPNLQQIKTKHMVNNGSGRLKMNGEGLLTIRNMLVMQAPLRRRIGHRLEAGSPDGVKVNLLQEERGGCLCQERVTVKVQVTKEIGDHPLREMSGDVQDLLTQEMKRRVPLEGMKETEGHHFLMSLAEGHLSLLTSGE